MDDPLYLLVLYIHQGECFPIKLILKIQAQNMPSSPWNFDRIWFKQLGRGYGTTGLPDLWNLSPPFTHIMRTVPSVHFPHKSPAAAPSVRLVFYKDIVKFGLVLFLNFIANLTNFPLIFPNVFGEAVILYTFSNLRSFVFFFSKIEHGVHCSYCPLITGRISGGRSTSHF